ncbi:unnamed protein product [Heterobilharzia americana]|nr:unnamed protein product [Heterobilharzia americana]
MAGTEQGAIISCNRKGKTPAEKIVAVYPGHIGPIYALQRNPFFPKNFLSIDGTLSIWDMIFKQKAPALNIQICDEPLHCLRIQEQGRLLATGSHSGVCTILELSEGFWSQPKNEKSVVTAMFERETHREKILEARHREIKLRKLKGQGTEETTLGAEEESYTKQVEELIRLTEDQFFETIERKFKERQLKEGTLTESAFALDNKQENIVLDEEEEERPATSDEEQDNGEKEGIQAEANENNETIQL